MRLYQCCPVCLGTGLVSRPPWVASDQPAFYADSVGPWPCKICDGAGIIETPSGRAEIMAEVK